MGAKNLLNPTFMGAFRACKKPSLWVQIFQKQGLSRGTSVETQSTEEPLPPGDVGSTCCCVTDNDESKFNRRLCRIVPGPTFTSLVRKTHKFGAIAKGRRRLLLLNERYTQEYVHFCLHIH